MHTFESLCMRTQAYAHGVQGLSAVMQARDEAACAAIERHAVRAQALKAVDCLLRLLQACALASLGLMC